MQNQQEQQNVEELRRQMDAIVFENKQASDQIQADILKMTMQFQEKILEMAPLPDLLKRAQIQLQQARQQQKLAEEYAQQIAKELEPLKEKCGTIMNALYKERIEKCKLIEDNNALKIELDELAKEVNELEKSIEDYKTIIRTQHECEIMYKEVIKSTNFFLDHLDNNLRERKERTSAQSGVQERSARERRSKSLS